MELEKGYLVLEIKNMQNLNTAISSTRSSHSFIWEKPHLLKR